MTDIEESLRQGYPDHLKYKLYERKAKCLHEIDETDNSVKVYKQTLTQIEMSNLDEKAQTKMRKTVNKQLRELENKLTSKMKSPIGKLDENVRKVKWPIIGHLIEISSK